MKYFGILIVGCIGLVLAAVDSGTSDNLPPQFHNVNVTELQKNLTSLTGLENLPINASHIPTTEEAEQIFKEKCEKIGGPDAFPKVLVAKEEVTQCVQSLVNFTELNEEMETAKPKGDLDLVFKKYCRKSPILQECISNFTTAVEPCLEEAEKESKRIIHNITDSLLGFICFKDGDRIALFIAEGGPKCFEEKRSGVEECLNKTTSKYMPKEMPTLSTLPLFVLGEQECLDMKVVQSCVVKVLEECSEPTPANIVESLFNYVWKITPCSKMTLPLTTGQGGSGSSRSAVTSFGIFSTFALFVLMRVLH